MEFTAQIEVRNGKIMIVPDSCDLEFDDFVWENRHKTVDDIIMVLPF